MGWPRICAAHDVRNSLTALLVALGWLASGCVGSAAFDTIAQGASGGYRERAALVIRTEEQWQALWDRHAATILPKPRPPKVDFTKEMVIAVFLGEQPTGGFSVTITQVEQRVDALRVVVEETAPPPDAMVTQAFSSPYHLVRLKTTDLPIDFEFRTSREKP